MSSSQHLIVSFDSGIFSQDAVLKACYEHATLAVFEVKIKDRNIIVSVEKHEEILVTYEDISKYLRTSVIDYQLREKILAQTKPIREILINAALKNAHKVSD